MDSNTNINNNETQKNKKGNNRQLFYGVIAVSTFIIMVVGATFAYFTANTSSADSSVRTGSTKLQLEYISYGDGWLKENLIPVDTNVAEYSVEMQNDSTQNRMCVDDFGNEICSLYVFQVRNTSNSPQEVSINLTSENNEFGSLHAMLYEISKGNNYDDTVGLVGGSDPDFALNSTTDAEDETKIKITDNNNQQLFTDTNMLSPIYVNRENVTKTLGTVNTSNATLTTRSIEIPVQASGSTVKLADGVVIPGVSSTVSDANLKTFMVVLYILNRDGNQNDTDAEKAFTGRIEVTTDDGGSGVSGYIGASSGANLQNLTTTTTETTETTETTDTTEQTTEP